jgi:hypothetical protein
LGNAAVLAAIAAFFSLVLLGILAPSRHVMPHTQKSGHPPRPHELTDAIPDLSFLSVDRLLDTQWLGLQTLIFWLLELPFGLWLFVLGVLACALCLLIATTKFSFERPLARRLVQPTRP